MTHPWRKPEDPIWRRGERPKEGDVITFGDRDAFVYRSGAWVCVLNREAQ